MGDAVMAMTVYEAEAAWLGLSGAAKDTLTACKSVVWDGDLPSKAGRDELVALGLVARYDGWQVVTARGLALLVGLGKSPAWNLRKCGLRA